MTRGHALLPAAALLLAGFVLTACEVHRADTTRDEATAAPDAEVDASGMDRREVAGEPAGESTEAPTRVRIDGQRVEDGARRAGQRLEDNAREVGSAVEKGAQELGRRAEPVLSDAAISLKVKTRLAADPEVNPFQIDVDTVEGRVTLNGVVGSRTAKDEAVKLARRTEGVVEVIDLLRVRGEAPPGAPAAPAPPKTTRPPPR